VSSERLSQEEFYDECDDRHASGPFNRFLPRLRKDRSEGKVVLCLSGGGFRAAAYHLGALRRLQELDVLRHIDEIRAVSGGAILAGFVAQLLGATNGRSIEGLDWETEVAAPFRRILSQDLRTLPVLCTLPVNFLWKAPRVGMMVRRLEALLGGACLSSLPVKPRFVFLATDLVSGRLVSIPGLAGTEDWTVARAAVASAAFPPILGPIRFRFASALGSSERALSDGGVWGNLGVTSGVLQTASVVLVSDASYPLLPKDGSVRFWLGRALRVSVQRGDSALRSQMWMHDSFRQRYEIWRIHETTFVNESGGLGGYEYSSKATSEISKIRTDLDAFTRAEIGILENHGYLRAASSISWLVSRERFQSADERSSARGATPSIEELDIHGQDFVSLLANQARFPMIVPPHPEYLNETIVLSKLTGSDRRLLKLRWLRRVCRGDSDWLAESPVRLRN
jgi:NTE family protein